MKPSDLPLLDLLRRRGMLSARDLQAALRVSQPTLSRLTRAAGGEVLQIGRARATRYALARQVWTFGSAWPVHRIDAAGVPSVVGTLRAVHPDGWWLETLDPVLRRVLDPGAPGLPAIVGTVRPTGFLGGVFARRRGAPMGLGADPASWSDDAVVAALLMYGDDLPGDLVLGDQALQRVSGADPIKEPQRPPAYAERARAVVAGEVDVPLLGGATPKFTATVGETADAARQVIVKVATDVHGVDGLRCEHLTAVVLRAHRIDASETDWIEYGDCCFLESRRFDRVGTVGRCGVLPLAAIAAAPVDDEVRLRRWLGRLLGTGDAVLRKTSVLLDAWPPRLAPVYGLRPLPMPAGVDPPLPPRDEVAVWRAAATVARDVWEYVVDDPVVSATMRADASRALDGLAAVARRV